MYYNYYLFRGKYAERASMKFATVSELRNKATQIVAGIEDTREEVIVTKNGKPVVLMRFITDEAFSLKDTEKEKRKEVKKNGKRNL
jgi:PHD/YefM family antitoxin component YafN of YafNO toxin-antitoxin module